MKKNLLDTFIAGLHLKNPSILASGILGYTSDSLQRIEEEGAGAVVTKSFQDFSIIAGVPAKITGDVRDFIDDEFNS